MKKFGLVLALGLGFSMSASASSLEQGMELVRSVLSPNATVEGQNSEGPCNVYLIDLRSEGSNSIEAIIRRGTGVEGGDLISFSLTNDSTVRASENRSGFLVLNKITQEGENEPSEGPMTLRQSFQYDAATHTVMISSDGTKAECSIR